MSDLAHAHRLAKRVFDLTTRRGLLDENLLFRSIPCAPHLVEVSAKPCVHLLLLNHGADVGANSFKTWVIKWQMGSWLLIAAHNQAKLVAEPLRLLP